MKKEFVKKICLCFMLVFILNTLFLPFVKAANTLDVDCPSALLMDLSSGKVLYEKDINKKRYPASLTKLLTAILAVENCELSEIATVSPNAVMSIPSGYVTANLQIGEELTIEQLLSVLLIRSANDSAIVLAEHVSGSIESFADLMNEKAKEIGCTSSNFTNPYGKHDINHYSTAYDLSLIAKYAMQNDFLKNLVSQTSYQLPSTNKYDKDDRLFRTSNALLIVNNNYRKDNYYYKYATGIKTGFTTPAQNCLIASANKGNLELLIVVLGGESTKDGLSERYLDAIDLFEYGYETYTLKKIVNKDDTIQTTNIDNATRDTKKLDAVVSEDVNVLIKQADKNNALLPEVKLNDELKAPISKGDVIGSVTYKIEDITYTENLLAKNDVEKSKAFINFIVLIIIFIILWFYLKIKQKRKKNKRFKNRIR